MAMDLNRLHSYLDSYMKIFLSREESKDGQVSGVYKNGVFKTKTKSMTSLTVLRYLLKLLVPARMTRVLWPLYDNRMEAEFRRVALEILTDIFKNISRVPPITMSILITPHGVKFVHILVNLCSEILKRDLKAQSEDMGVRVTQIEKQCVRTKPVGEEVGVKIMAREVERTATARLRDQLVSAQHFVDQAQVQASELTSSIKQTEESINKVETEAEKYLKQNSLDVNMIHDDTKMSDFHTEVEKQSTQLTELTTKTSSLLSSVASCDNLALAPLQFLNGGDSTVDLVAVVREAKQFRESNPVLSLFGAFGSEDPACISLMKQFTSLVISTDETVSRDIADLETSKSAKQAEYDTTTQNLMRELNWEPSIPEPQLAICDADWLNTWDAQIRGEEPVDCEATTLTADVSQMDLYQQFRTSVQTFLDTCHKGENEKEEQRKQSKPKLSLMDILFSDLEEPKASPTSCSQNMSQQNSRQQNTVMSPTSSGSPLACSSRIISSLASTPVKKQAESPPAKKPEDSPNSTPSKKREDSLLRYLLYNKMSERLPSPSPEGSPGPKSPGGNQSFGNSSFKLPSNLSQTTCSESTSFLDASVQQVSRQMDIFDALLDVSNPSPFSPRALTPTPASNNPHTPTPPVHSPTLPNHTPTSPRDTFSASQTLPPIVTPVQPKPRQSVLVLIERFQKLKEKQRQERSMLENSVIP
ncbi:hypothetical protein M8J75_001410 [Diaphorina citri]|nr:hypothetical protein M8J75_001410 [Diaphorina citri]